MKKFKLFKNIFIFLMPVVMSATVLSGCVSGENMDKNNEYESKADYYFAFDENDALKESVSGDKYGINYVFSSAAYKSPSNVPLSAGVRGKSMLFDGYSTYSDTTVVRCGEKLTVSVWVAPRAFSVRDDKKLTGIVSCLDDNGGFELGVYNYGSWCFKARTNKGVFQIYGDNAELDLYKWNYLTAVFNGAERKMYLYKNGVEVAKSNILGDKILPSASKLRIGCITQPAFIEGTFNANVFSGLIDELEIYDNVLSEKNIKSNFETLSKGLTLDVYKDLWLNYDVLADDRYAPQYHMRVSQNWQNETYGLFYYKGLYHAFCQQNVFGPYYTEGQRWGHMISADLVHWEELVPVLVPEANGIDDNHVFSGTAVLDKNGNPVIFYTGVNYGNANYLNVISIARPDDLSDMKLEKWNKSGEIVVNQGNLSTRDNFRDPFVYVEDGEYFMLIGATEKTTGNGAIYCYKAINDELTEWQFLGETYSGDRSEYKYLGTCYELPNLFKLKSDNGAISKYMLMLSPIGGTSNGVYYLLGEFDKTSGRFTPDREEPYRYDVGPVSQVLCPSGFYDSKTDRNIILTMCRTGMDSEQRYKSGWATAMTLLKQVTLSENGQPVFTPIDEYASLEKQVLVNLQGNYEIDEVNSLISGVRGDMLKIEIEAKLEGNARFGVYVKYDSAGIERAEVYYDLYTKTFYVDSTKSSADMRHNGAGGGRVELDGDTVKLTVYTDRAMIEAYLNGKNQATAFGFNSLSRADGVKLYSKGGTVKILNLKISSMADMAGNGKEAYWG